MANLKTQPQLGLQGDAYTMPAMGFPEYLPRIQKHPNIPRNSRIPRPWYIASADASGAMA